jgi:hypothetical protein
MTGRLAALGFQIARRRWVRAGCRLVTVAILAALAAVAWDALVEAAHPLARGLVLVVAAAICGGFAWYQGRRIWHVPSALDVAWELQRREPRLGSLLSSGVEFAVADPQQEGAGSLELRQTTVLRAAAEIERLDLAALLPRRSLRRALTGALLAMAVFGLAAWQFPSIVTAGLPRLVNPWSARHWPRAHDLVFSDPPRQIVVGQDFRATLVDREGILPPTIEVQYRFDDAQGIVETQQLVGEGTAIEVGRPQVSSSFFYRAVGGDHRDMPWHKVEAVSAPRIEQKEVRVVPPSYTGRAPFVVSDGAPIRAIVGSGLALRATVDRPVATARLLLPSGATLACRLSDEGRTLEIAPGAWQVEQSGTPVLELTTLEGPVARVERAMRIEAVDDRPPQIDLVSPVDGSAVVATAVVRVGAEVRDDVGTRSATLRLSASSAQRGLRAGPETSDTDPGSGELRLPGGARKVAEREVAESEVAESEVAVQPIATFPLPGVTEASVAIDLDLASQSLVAGQVLELRATAEDFCGQESRPSAAVRLRIVTAETLRRELRAAATQLVVTLRGARRLQQVNLAVTAGERPVVPPPEAELARFGTAVARQQQVSRLLVEGPQNAREQAAQWLAMARQNQIELGAVEGGLRQLVDDLEQLQQDALPMAETRFDEILRWVAAAHAAQSEISFPAEAWGEVEMPQQQILAAIEAALRLLASWDDAESRRETLAEIRARQDALLAATEAQGRAALAGTVPQQKGDNREAAAQLQRRQQALAAEFKAWLVQQPTPAATDELADDAIAGQAAPGTADRANARLQESVLAMEEAAQRLAAAQWGRSVAQQRRALELMLEVEGGAKLPGGAVPIQVSSPLRSPRTSSKRKRPQGSQGPRPIPIARIQARRIQASPRSPATSRLAPPNRRLGWRQISEPPSVVPCKTPGGLSRIGIAKKSCNPSELSSFPSMLPRSKPIFGRSPASVGPPNPPRGESLNAAYPRSIWGVSRNLFMLLLIVATGLTGGGQLVRAEQPLLMHQPLVTPEAAEAAQRGLAFLAAEQLPTGAFAVRGNGRNPAVCGLAGMAFLAAGSTPGRGPTDRQSIARSTICWPVRIASRD